MSTTIKERAEAIDTLRERVPRGTRIYAIVRNVSRSGMSRHMDFYMITGNQPVYLTGYIATILGLRRGNHGAKVDGVGMDMAFATVYNLGLWLYDDGYALTSEIL